MTTSRSCTHVRFNVTDTSGGSLHHNCVLSWAVNEIFTEHTTVFTSSIYITIWDVFRKIPVPIAEAATGMFKTVFKMRSCLCKSFVLK